MKNTLLVVMFWKTVTSFTSDKFLSTKRLTLVENDEIINNDSEAANVMNFSLT